MNKFFFEQQGWGWVLQTKKFILTYEKKSKMVCCSLVPKVWENGVAFPKLFSFKSWI